MWCGGNQNRFAGKMGRRNTHLNLLQYGGHTAAVLETSPAGDGGHAPGEIGCIGWHTNGHCKWEEGGGMK